MNHQEYALETIGLVKCFKGVRAVDELSVKVPEGSIYGFLGPNGAGKTTTLKMITGLSKPTAGKIKICGREVMFGSHKNRHAIGFLPDVPCFYDWMTAAEYLKFCGELFTMDRKKLTARIEYLLDLVSLADVKKKIAGYSRGMKQRLGIAQALVNEPRVVFLDEPTSALDPIGRKEVMDIIARLAGKVTVLFSTHILSDIERVCDRVVILNRGKAVLEDTMENLKRNYTKQGILLEVEDADGDFLDRLGKMPWVRELCAECNGQIKIYVHDLELAQRSIPAILCEKRRLLKRFAILEPDLEEVFLKVVDQQ